MVKKIFTVLGTAVACIIAIAFLLNIVLPNGLNGISNAIENSIQQATGVEIDLNGDGTHSTDEKSQDDYSSGKTNAVSGFNGTVNGN